MPTVRGVIVFALAAAGGVAAYEMVQQSYTAQMTAAANDSKAAKKEIAKLFPYIRELRETFHDADSPTPYLWLDATRALEGAAQTLREPQINDPKRDCKILWDLNAINIQTGYKYPLSPEGVETVRNCGKYVINFHRT